MIGLFKRVPKAGAPDTAALGGSALALRVPTGCVVPSGCLGVAFGKGGAARRIEQGGRIALDDQEGAFCFHPGPYEIELTPFAAAPEMGLRLTFAVDSPDPRVARQRFDLYLASEGGDGVTVTAFAGAIETAVRRELAQGNLDLPPCTSIDEWNQFRAGLNQLLYQRFGITVEDCVPVDLNQVDYARQLLERAVVAPAAPVRPKAATTELADAPALRRLFLELPGVTSALRLVSLPPGQTLFRQHQELLQRLDHVSALCETMPALELAAPGKPLAAAGQAARARHSAAAVRALDEAWALVARFAVTPAPHIDGLFDDADRIVANLEHHGAGRRALAEGEPA